MHRRDFVGLMGTAAGVVPAGAGPASADRVRVLPSIEHTDDLKTFFDGVRVGELRAHGALAVFWLDASPPATALDVLTLDEARAGGDVVVRERPDAVVSAAHHRESRQATRAAARG